MKSLSRFRSSLILGAVALVFGVVQADRAASAVSPGPPPTTTSLTQVARLPAARGSDLAFWGDLAFAGSFDGFRIIDISSPSLPRLLAEVACPGQQGDISVWSNLVFVSVDRPMTRPDCDGVPAADRTDPGTFEGIRIFDVHDPREPRFLTGVATDCGSHTNTLVPDLDRNRVLVYVSNSVMLPNNGAHCGPGRELDPQHGHYSIVAVPLGHPEEAALVATPLLGAPAYGLAEAVGALPTVACHDVTVFLELRLAAASCMSEPQLWPLADLASPGTSAAVHLSDPALVDRNLRGGDVFFWHSATFTWDGRYVVFGDEYPLTDGCQHPRGGRFGRLWIYEVARPEHPLASFNLPYQVAGNRYCTVHLYNFIPIRDRYLLVAAWYTGGVDVIDFSHPTQPVEVAYSGPTAGPDWVWAAYWYNGYIYANGFGQGLVVLRWSDPLAARAVRLDHLNPQAQEKALR